MAQPRRGRLRPTRRMSQLRRGRLRPRRLGRPVDRKRRLGRVGRSRLVPVGPVQRRGRTGRVRPPPRTPTPSRLRAVGRKPGNLLRKLDQSRARTRRRLRGSWQRARHPPRAGDCLPAWGPWMQGWRLRPAPARCSWPHCSPDCTCSSVASRSHSALARRSSSPCSSPRAGAARSEATRRLPTSPTHRLSFASARPITMGWSTFPDRGRPSGSPVPRTATGTGGRHTPTRKLPTSCTLRRSIPSARGITVGRGTTFRDRGRPPGSPVPREVRSEETREVAPY